jgi:hypothetical protein
MDKQLLFQTLSKIRLPKLQRIFPGVDSRLGNEQIQPRKIFVSTVEITARLSGCEKTRTKHQWLFLVIFFENTP